GRAAVRAARGDLARPRLHRQGGGRPDRPPQTRPLHAGRASGLLAHRRSTSPLRLPGRAVDVSRRLLIGVLGGLGPAATVDFYAKVVSRAAAAGAASDQEHVRLLIDADPEVPDRNRSIGGTGPSSAPALVAKA